MPWFYYSGNIVRSITVKKGVSIAVRPHSKIEILTTNTSEFKKLSSMGLLRPSSKKKNVKDVKEIKPVSIDEVKKVTLKSKFAKSIAEKGITSSPDIAPKASGKVELTDAEVELAKVTSEGVNKLSEADGGSENKQDEMKAKTSRKK